MISVCLTTYNGEKFIKEQLTSILHQIGDKDEIILSDDGSKDNTLAIVNSIGDSRIKIFYNRHQHGFIGNFENALENAHGDYIFLSDQDDIWKPNKVKCVMTYLNKYDLVVHDAEIIDGKGKTLGKNYYSTMHNKSGFLANLYSTRFLGCCMAFTKKVKDKSLPIPHGVVGHDYWIGMYAKLKFKTIFIPDILISYRRHGNNVSPSSEKSKTSLFYKIFIKRLPLLWNLFLRYFK